MPEGIVATNYANLFLGFWEKKFVFSDSNPYFKNVIWWGRYIDIILIWTGSEADLLAFHSYLNNTYANLKLSLDFSHTHFLDLKIFKESNGVLNTTIFRKETGRNTILRAASFHPLWMAEYIPFGEFQRLKRICDKEEDFDIRAEDMTQRFQERGFKNSVIKHTIK